MMSASDPIDPMPQAEKPIVEVVIINYKRPANIGRIIVGFRAQTLPCKITICDAGSDEYALTADISAMADRVLRWNDNLGSFNRFVCAFALHCPFTYFHDDDMVPGPRLLEGFLFFSKHAFSVMGQLGRVKKLRGFEKVGPKTTPVVVDFVCRGYWLNTKDVPLILKFLWYAWEQGINLKFREDDILMAMSIRTYTGRPALVVPPIEGGAMNAKELPAPFAMWRELDHVKRRLGYFELLRKIASMIHGNRERLILASAPPSNWRNLGDHIQLLAIQKWLAKKFASHSMVTLNKNQTKLVEKLGITDRDRIVFVSGGNLGDRGQWSESGRREIVGNFKEVPSIILQQTVYFSNTENGRKEKAKSTAAYQGHRRLKMVARDPVSKELFDEMVPGACVAIAPDFGLYLDGYFRLPIFERDGILIILRSDSEAIVPREEIIESLSGLGLMMRMGDTSAEVSVTDGLREWLISEKLAEFAAHRVVVTDRFHGVIFSVLTRTPCVVLPTADHKLSSMAHWLKGITAVRFVPFADCDLAEAVDSVMAGGYDQLMDFKGCFENLFETLFE